MPDPGCLVIDDCEAALAQMTDLGRGVAYESAMMVRKTIVAIATRRRWTVLRYDAFRDWALGVAENADVPWVILDPLFRAQANESRFRSLRVSHVGAGRYQAEDGWRVVFSDAAAVGVIDDAVASGGTLRCLAEMAKVAGSRLAHVTISASRRGPAEFLRSAIPALHWRQYLPGDWRIMHLRDACPYLPFSGGRTARRVALDDGHELGIRTPASAVEGSLWQVLYLDQTVRESVVRAHKTAEELFAVALGRPPVVRDLHSLGDVGVVVDSATANTTFLDHDTPLLSIAHRG